jgi:hypothetical protein
VSIQRAEGRTLAYVAWCALIVVIAVVSAAGFALTFHGLLGYGRDLVRLGRFAFLVPVMTDGLTIVAIMATFLLAYVLAPWQPKLYAWLVFAVANAASVAGNTSYALYAHLPRQGIVGAALCPVFVALSAHLAIVCWRHWRPAPVDAAVEPVGTDATDDLLTTQDREDLRNLDADFAASVDAQSATPSEPVAQPTPRRATTRRAKRTAQPVDAAQRGQVRSAYAAGEGIGAIEKRLNGLSPSRRTLENWTADLREVHAQARAVAQSELADAVAQSSDG